MIFDKVLNLFKKKSFALQDEPGFQESDENFKSQGGECDCREPNCPKCKNKKKWTDKSRNPGEANPDNAIRQRDIAMDEYTRNNGHHMEDDSVPFLFSINEALNIMNPKVALSDPKESEYRKMVEDAGGQYVGLQDTGEGNFVVLFNNDKNTTLALTPEEMTQENVKNKLSKVASSIQVGEGKVEKRLCAGDLMYDSEAIEIINSNRSFEEKVDLLGNVAKKILMKMPDNYASTVEARWKDVVIDKKEIKEAMERYIADSKKKSKSNSSPTECKQCAPYEPMVFNPKGCLNITAGGDTDGDPIGGVAPQTREPRVDSEHIDQPPQHKIDPKEDKKRKRLNKYPKTHSGDQFGSYDWLGDFPEGPSMFSVECQPYSAVVNASKIRNSEGKLETLNIMQKKAGKEEISHSLSSILTKADDLLNTISKMERIEPGMELGNVDSEDLYEEVSRLERRVNESIAVLDEMLLMINDK